MPSSQKRCFSAYTLFANDSVEGTIYIPGNCGKRIKKTADLEKKKSLSFILFINQQLHTENKHRIHTEYVQKNI